LSTQLYAQLAFIEEGRRTRRYHAGLNMHEYQRIDAHSYGVAMLTRIIVPECTPERRSRLLIAALDHDLPECRTGDVPAPAKRRMGIREQLQDEEAAIMASHGMTTHLNSADKRVLAIADSAEGCLHCIAERQLGNRNVEPIFITFWAYLRDEQGFTTAPEPEAGEVVLYHYLSDSWEAAGGNW
jgi:5'-deoxynucleotidase YfbR-like HD superfamily hydrolase